MYGMITEENENEEMFDLLVKYYQMLLNGKLDEYIQFNRLLNDGSVPIFTCMP